MDVGSSPARGDCAVVVGFLGGCNRGKSYFHYLIPRFSTFLYN